MNVTEVLVNMMLWVRQSSLRFAKVRVKARAYFWYTWNLPDGHFMHILATSRYFSASFWPVVGSLGTFEAMFRKSWLKELSGIFCYSHFSEMWQFGAIFRHSL